MSEYGSGIFYGKANGRFLNSSQVLSSSISQVLSLPSDLDIGPPIIAAKTEIGNLKKSQLPKLSDVVILSEFSEIEGPIALVTIPEEIPEDLNLNDLVLQLMSTDYQNTGTGDFTLSKDTSLFLQDYQKSHHIYVHYFTLYDIRARGFVRPMCLSYITRETQKIRMFYKEIKEEFNKMTEYLRVTNLQYFSKEIKGRIKDLHFTKKRYIYAHDHLPTDDKIKSPSSPKVIPLLYDRSEFHKCKKSELEDSLNSNDGICTPVVLGSSSDNMNPLESSTLASHIQFQFSPVKSLKASPRGSPKDGILESSSDSSTSTVKSIKFSSLMLDDSLNEKITDTDEKSILQHTSLDALAAQLLDCQFIGEIVEKYLSASNVVEELDEFLLDVESNIKSPVFKAVEDLNILDEMIGEGDATSSPSVFVIALMRRSFRTMRKIRKLCGIGYAAALIKLFDFYEKFSKSCLTLRFEYLDREIYEDPMSSLFVGHIPVIHSGTKNALPLSQSRSFNLNEACWDKEIARLIRMDLSETSTPESEYIDASETFELLPSGVTLGDDCLEVFSKSPKRRHHSCPSSDSSTGSLDSDAETGGAMALPRRDRHPSTPIRSTSSDESWTSYRDSESEGEEGVEEEPVPPVSPDQAVSNRVLHLDIQERMDKGNVYHICTMLQQFSGVSQSIINSILSGRPIIIAGPEYLKKLVVLYGKALSTILPYKPNQCQPILKWLTGTVTQYHTDQYQIIGICIPERLHVQDLMSISTLNKVTVLNIETGHISGVAYSGTYLRKGDQLSPRKFKANQTLQAAMQSIIISLGLKCYLLFHLLRTTTKSCSEILKGIGVPRGDWAIIQFLTRMMEEQVSHPVSPFK